MKTRENSNDKEFSKDENLSLNSVDIEMGEFNGQELLGF